jgi:hypothetical protein
MIREEVSMLTVLPRLNSLKTIQDTPIIPGRHLDAQRGGHEAEVQCAEVLLPVPWRRILFDQVGYLRDFRDVAGGDVVAGDCFGHGGGRLETSRGDCVRRWLETRRPSWFRKPCYILAIKEYFQR